MGVRGLTQLLTRYAPKSVTGLTPKRDMAGWRLAVDSNIYLQQFIRGTTGDSSRHLQGMARLNDSISSFCGSAVFVFDGKGRAQAKSAELAKRSLVRQHTGAELDSELARAARIESLVAISHALDSDDDSGYSVDDARCLLDANRELIVAAQGRRLADRLDMLELDVIDTLRFRTGSDIEAKGATVQELEQLCKERIVQLDRRVGSVDEAQAQCLKMLRGIGVPCYVAESEVESEAVCAELARRGMVDAVCSEDLDVVAYGARLVRGFPADPVLIDGTCAMRELGLTREQFVDLCILCGTDFASTLEKVGPITALKLVKKHGSIEHILENTKFVPRPGFEYGQARAVFGAKIKIPFASFEELLEGPQDKLADDVFSRADEALPLDADPFRPVGEAVAFPDELSKRPW